MNSEQSSGERVGVSTLELFFDLVFVFTITQLTGVLSDVPTWEGVARVVLMLGIIFWMYGGYAWLTNAVTVDRLLRRLILLGGMAGFFAIALAIPQAFDGAGLTFGLAYLAVIVIHFGMFVRANRVPVVKAMVGLIPFNLAGAALVLIGGALGGDAQYALWTAAFLLLWISPKLIDDSGFEIRAGHFVERHGLIVIVAIGESIVAVGVGAEGLPVDFDLLAAAFLGLALSAGLWWSYFGADEELPERRMEAAPMAKRPQLAINGYGYAHILILLGIVGIACALKAATGHAFDELEEAKAIFLGAGIATFLLGEAWFRRTLGMGAAQGRIVAAALAVATIPVGIHVSAAAQIVLLIAVIIAMVGLQGPAAEQAPDPAA